MASELPDYVASARPVPADKRAPWYMTVAQTYAGIMLWFVFWQAIVGDGPGGALSQGLGVAIGGVVIAALICHFLFYLVPGILGMKTGLPLYVVGTSTYGVTGGLIMPGFVMGLLQFGWVAVNASGVATLLCLTFDVGVVKQAEEVKVVIPGLWHGGFATIFALLVGFIGLKGIQYVARVATFLPLIPLVLLIVLVAKTGSGLSNFTTAKVVGGAAGALGIWGVLNLLITYIVGFFATAGAAGTDIASSSRDGKDVQLGGTVGIVLATVFSGAMALLVVAGVYGMAEGPVKGGLNPVQLMKFMIFSGTTSQVIMILLAISSIPAGCFSAFIAANSFKTTLPKVNPFVSVGIGIIVAVVLAVFGIADQVIKVFVVIGASFGPVCGAMVADYLLAGRKWAGPRAGFNPAGWISWIVGFAVGAFNLVVPMLGRPDLSNLIPVPPVSAFVVGFVLYLILGGLGMTSRTLAMPSAASPK